MGELWAGGGSRGGKSQFPGCVHRFMQQRECPAVGRDCVFREKCCNCCSLSIFSGKEQGRDAQGLVEGLILGCREQNSKVSLPKGEPGAGAAPRNTNTPQREKWEKKLWGNPSNVTFQKSQ